MLKYLKRAYIMSVASYEVGGNGPEGGAAETPENKLKNLSTFDELTNQLLAIQKELFKKPGNDELVAELNQIIEKRTQEQERLKLLYNPKLVTQFISEQLQNYSSKLNEFQNIRLARIEAQDKRKEKIATTSTGENLLPNGEDTLAQENPLEKTDKTKPLEEKDINFVNGKDTYLPKSAFEKGYLHRLTKAEVIKALDGKTVKQFQKENGLKDDGKIGGKTYLAIMKALKIEK